MKYLNIIISIIMFIFIQNWHIYKVNMLIDNPLPRELYICSINVTDGTIYKDYELYKYTYINNSILATQEFGNGNLWKPNLDYTKSRCYTRGLNISSSIYSVNKIIVYNYEVYIPIISR